MQSKWANVNKWIFCDPASGLLVFHVPQSALVVWCQCEWVWIRWTCWMIPCHIAQNVHLLALTWIWMNIHWCLKYNDFCFTVSYYRFWDFTACFYEPFETFWTSLWNTWFWSVKHSVVLHVLWWDRCANVLYNFETK